MKGATGIERKHNNGEEVERGTSAPGGEENQVKIPGTCGAGSLEESKQKPLGFLSKSLR